MNSPQKIAHHDDFRDNHNANHGRKWDCKCPECTCLCINCFCNPECGPLLGNIICICIEGLSHCLEGFLQFLCMVLGGILGCDSN